MRAAGAHDGRTVRNGSGTHRGGQGIAQNVCHLAQGQFTLMTRQALHCLWVEFPRPSDKKVVHIEAPVPEDMEKVIKKLRKGI